MTGGGRATRDLSALFAPDSVAIVGASDDPVKWGNWLARGALRGERRRRVYLVNRRASEVLRRPAYRSLAELPEAPGLAVIAVPSAALEATVDEAIGHARPASCCSGPTASASSMPDRSSTSSPTSCRAGRSG